MDSLIFDNNACLDEDIDVHKIINLIDKASCNDYVMLYPSDRGFSLHGNTIIRLIKYIDQNVNNAVEAEVYFYCIADVFVRRGVDRWIADCWIRYRYFNWKRRPK